MKVKAIYKDGDISIDDNVYNFYLERENNEVWLDWNAEYDKPRETLYLKNISLILVDNEIVYMSERDGKQ